MGFLRFVSPCYFMIAIKLTTDGIIRGAGRHEVFCHRNGPGSDPAYHSGEYPFTVFSQVRESGMAWPFGSGSLPTVLTIIFYRKITAVEETP